MISSTSTFRAALAALLVLPLGLALSCSSGGSSDSATTEFDGAWQGTWSTSTPGPTGTLTLQLTQVGNVVTGTGTFDGHPCFGTCEVQCEVQGDQISGDFQAGALHMHVWGGCSGHQHGMGAHHAANMSCSYQIMDGGCSGELGVAELTPVPATLTDGAGPDAAVVGRMILIDPATDEEVQLPLVRPVEAGQ